MKICIVIPVYKDQLTFHEQIAFNRCIEVLDEFDIYFCEPVSLNTQNIRLKHKHINVAKFDDRFFKGIIGYNELMLSSEFYKRFKNYDYMLLCQLDAYIFKNTLVAWCSKGYDYIGSPWLANRDNLIKKLKRTFKPQHKKNREQIFFKVGNGGLSLRKIKSFLQILKENSQLVKEQLDISKEDYRLMEDVFWSIEAPKLNPLYKIPDYKEAVYFSIDRRPKLGFRLTNNTQPFGCHGFNKKNVISFWKTKIPELKQS